MNRQAQKTQRINSFDALRGILACWVLFVHIGVFSAITPNMGGVIGLAAFFNKTAGHAVEVFMILSGFVIFYLLEKSGEGYSVFIFRRFFRLFPVFIISLLVGVLLNPIHQHILANVSWAENPWIKNQLALAQNDSRYAFQHILWHLPMLHGVVPGNILPLADSAFSGPSWSISIEWQFYLIAPFLFIMSRTLIGFLSFAAIVVLAPLLPPLVPSINYGQPMRSFLLTQISWFYVGISSFYIYRESVGFPRADAKIFKIISFLMLSYLVFRIRYWYGMAVWIVFFSLVVANLSTKAKSVAPAIRLLNSSFLQYIGKISYPIYLLHWPIIILAIRVLLFFNSSIDNTRAYYTLLITVPLFTLLLAHLVHHWIELPCINYALKACQTKTRRKKQLGPLQNLLGLG